ncbi:hypothetical protein D3C76_1615700 [compost metagenome]
MCIHHVNGRDNQISRLTDNTVRTGSAFLVTQVNGDFSCKLTGFFGNGVHDLVLVVGADLLRDAEDM